VTQLEGEGDGLSTEGLYSDECWGVLRTLCLRRNGTEVAAAALSLLARVVRYRVDHWESRWGPDMDWWSETVLECSGPLVSESLRQSVGTSLKLAGVPLIISSNSHRELEPAMLRIVRSVYTLLEDEQKVIRQSAAVCVVALHSATKFEASESTATVTSLQSEIAIKLFGDLLQRHCWWSLGLLQLLWTLICNTPSSRALLEPELAGKQLSLFEPDGANVYAEPVVLLAHHTHLIKNIMNKCLAANTSEMTSWVTDVVIPQVRKEVDDVSQLLGQCNDVTSGSKLWVRLSNKALSPLSTSKPYLVIARLLAQMDVAQLLGSAVQRELTGDRSDGHVLDGVTWSDEPLIKLLKIVSLHDAVRQYGVR